MIAKITGVKNKPEDNGDYLVELQMPGGEVTTASISLNVAQALVNVLQPAIVEEVRGHAESMSFPELRVKGASMVQGDAKAELMVDTNRMGHVVLLMSDEWLIEVRQTIDQVLASRASSPTVQ
jgi:hypothetical protein